MDKKTELVEVARVHRWLVRNDSDPKNDMWIFFKSFDVKPKSKTGNIIFYPTPHFMDLVESLSCQQDLYIDMIDGFGKTMFTIKLYGATIQQSNANDFSLDYTKTDLAEFGFPISFTDISFMRAKNEVVIKTKRSKA